MHLMTTSQNLLQKNSFLTTTEFVDWLTLVCELADKPLREVEVTRETFTMLIRDWATLANYAWTSRKISFAIDGNAGDLELQCPWGRVRIVPTNN